MFSQKVSVIIRTYNEGLYITNLLRAIKQQEYPNIEIILVDSESTGDTVKLAEQYCDKIVGIKKSDFTFSVQCTTYMSVMYVYMSLSKFFSIYIKVQHISTYNIHLCS